MGTTESVEAGSHRLRQETFQRRRLNPSRVCHIPQKEDRADNLGRIPTITRGRCGHVTYLMATVITFKSDYLGLSSEDDYICKQAESWATN